MGHNDHLDDDRPDLPRDAGRETESGFDPHSNWLAAAEPELRQEAMRRWFFSHYWDPANDTPYNGSEGGYLYIHGGPFDAEEELYGRFGEVCSDEEIREVIDDIESDGITEWAPIHHEREEEYDDRFALELDEGSEPLRRLRDRLRQSRQILTLQGDAEALRLAQQLVFSAAIGALEAYLYEVASFWIETDEKALRGLVQGLPLFREQRMPISELFERHAGVKKHVKGHLQNLVWHRWGKVKEIFQHALSVELPDTRPFEAPLLKRHAIVHRSGHDKNGTPVTVTGEEIGALCAAITGFAEQLDARVGSRGIDRTSADESAPDL